MAADVVLLCDTADRLDQMAAAFDGPWQVERAEDGYRAVELAPRVHPHASVTRAGLAGPPLPDLVRRLKELGPDGVVLVIVDSGDDALDALRSGADGVLVPHAEPGFIRWSVDRALEGGIVIAPPIARGLVSALTDATHHEREYRRQLSEHAREAGEAERSKADFVANVSHELRTPLTVIRGTAGVLAQKAGPDVAPLVAPMKEAADKLSRMVDDLVSLAEMERGDLELKIEPFDMAAAIRAAAQEARARYPEVEVEITIPPSLPLQGDPDRLAEVVLHLVDNACRWSESGGAVRVSARAAEEGTTVSVLDHGPGVDRDVVRAAFGGPFAAGEDVLTKEKAGLGIGLHLAREIIGLHGGILWAEPVPGGGSRASFTLPPAEAG